MAVPVCSRLAFAQLRRTWLIRWPQVCPTTTSCLSPTCQTPAPSSSMIRSETLALLDFPTSPSPFGPSISSSMSWSTSWPTSGSRKSSIFLAIAGEVFSPVVSVLHSFTRTLHWTHSWLHDAEFEVRRQPPGLKGIVLSSSLAQMSLWVQSNMQLMSAFPHEVQDGLKGGFSDMKKYRAALEQFYTVHACRITPQPKEVAAGGLNPIFGDRETGEGGDPTSSLAMFVVFMPFRSRPILIRSSQERRRAQRLDYCRPFASSQSPLPPHQRKIRHLPGLRHAALFRQDSQS